MTTTRLWLDFETYSATDIRAGTHRYAADAEILICAFAVDDKPVTVLDYSAWINAAPGGLLDLLTDPTVEVWAHNSQFDRTVLRHAWGIEVPVTRWRDTMVQALAHSLPASLGALGEALGLPADQAKDKDGKRLINLFCKPRPARQRLRRATRGTHPDDWARFMAYAGQDIDAMRECARRMPTWNYRGAELALWHLDQRINDRGVQIDIDLVHAALAAVEQAQVELSERARALTGASATQRAAVLAHLADAHGEILPDLTKATVADTLARADLDPAAREVLEIRQQASASSTAKYEALAAATSADGRLRGVLQFCGAARTGRWAGRTFQPQNLPRPTMEQADIDMGIRALKGGYADLIYADVMGLASNCIRSVIVAPAGRKLVVTDLSNIEGRMLAWLAGEAWKLDAFRAFDAGTGPDLYKLAYAKSFGIAPEQVDKTQRQVGKVQELALGYEGGVGAFLTFAAAYRIDLEAMAVQAWPAIPGEVKARAAEMLAYTRKQGRPLHGLSDLAWMVCEAFKASWRSAHPAVAAWWKSVGGAAISATEWPGQTFAAGSVKARRDGNWLRIALPSGRALCYPAPRVEAGVLSYAGQDQYTRKWSRLSTYGGKLVENITQAAARDVLAGNLARIEAAGYEIVLTVHDEVITEAPDTPEFDVAHLSSLLATPPAWAPDLPLAAAGFESPRYRKD